MQAEHQWSRWYLELPVMVLMGSEAGHDRGKGFVITGISPNSQTSDYRLGAIDGHAHRKR